MADCLTFLLIIYDLVFSGLKSTFHAVDYEVMLSESEYNSLAIKSRDVLLYIKLYRQQII